MTRVACVVLAAGASTRMGGRPKALLQRDGRTAVAAIADAAARAGCDPVVIVLGHHADAVRAGAGALPDVARVVTNPRPERGRSSSVKRGLAALAPDVDAALVWPVDHPCVSATTARTLVDAWRRHHAEVLVPFHRGRRGHPILLAEAAIATARKLADDAPLRDVVRAADAGLREVPVPDAAVLVNVDTPEDAARVGWVPAAPVAPPEGA